MARLLKCPRCGQCDHKENMIYDEQTKRHYHQLACYDNMLKDRESTRIENEQWDALYQYIIKLHDLVVLPKGNITRLKDLRAGYIMKNGKQVRQWRTGPDFSLMLDAYKLAENDIKWCIANKLDNSNDIKAINYCMSIMINKLNEANDRRKRRRVIEKQKQKVSLQDKEINININNKVNIINDEMDITGFL
ncbi:hypothetical protein D3C73_510050 [compost metagenome]